jgi:hypothetical protein
MPTILPARETTRGAVVTGPVQAFSRAAWRGDVMAVAIFVVTRLVDAVFIVVAARRQQPLLSLPASYHVAVPAPSRPGYFDVVTSWDGQWYWDIVLHGYPGSALDAAGQPAQTSLAFYPLYPTLVRFGTTATGLDFRYVAPMLSLLLGAAAFVVLYRLLRQVVDPRRALLGLAVLGCFASAPAFQIAYTESLALLLLATTLLLIRRRSYAVAAVTVLMLGLTRNISLALAPVVVAHWFATVRSGRRRERPPLRTRDHLACGALLVTTFAAAAEWPILAGVATGEPDAYLTTMKAWPGYSTSVLSPPWLEFVRSSGPTAVLVLLLALCFFAALMVMPTARRLGPELWAWACAYPAYLFAGVGATTSLLRYLLLCFPFALFLVAPAFTKVQQRRQVAIVSGVCLLGLASQWWWISNFLVPSSAPIAYP